MRRHPAPKAVRPLVPLALLAMILAVAAAPPAAAASALTLGLDETEGDAHPGETRIVELALRNTASEPLEVALTASSSVDITVELPGSVLFLEPGDDLRVPARITIARDAAPGERIVAFEASWRAADGAGIQEGRAHVEHRLRVTAPPTAPPRDPQDMPAPTLMPDAADVTATRGGTPVTVTFTARNPFDAPIAMRFEADLPPGWRVAFDPASVDVPAHGERTFRATFGADDDAIDGQGELRAGNGRQWLRASLALTAADPAPSQATAEPGAQSGDAADAAEPPSDPVAETQDDATATPPPPEEAAPAPPEAFEPPRLEVFVEPAEVEVAPDGTASATLVVIHRGDAPRALAPRLDLPDGFTGSLPALARDLPPDRRVTLPILLHASDLPEGHRDEARVHVEGADAPAVFMLRVVAPAPVDTASTAEAGGGEAALPLKKAGLTLALTGVGVLALAWPRIRRALPLLLLAPLYARLRPDKLLDHPARQAIVEHVRARPGLTLAELQRATGLANGALAHHVRQLERARLVLTYTDGAQRRVRLPGHDAPVPELPLAERALRTLAHEGPLSAAELARRLGVSRQLVHHHLKTLRHQGRVQVEGGLVRASELAARLVVEA